MSVIAQATVAIFGFLIIVMMGYTIIRMLI
jgi:hypothetical protein